MDIDRVHPAGVQLGIEISRLARKQLRFVPAHIASKLKEWVELVEVQGLRAARAVPGFHDEPLYGRRAGQRSIRLNKNYRAIYESLESGRSVTIKIPEVNKHDY